MMPGKKSFYLKSQSDMDKLEYTNNDSTLQAAEK